MLRTKTTLAVAAALVGCSALGARADLTMNGAVGLPLNPTTSLPPGFQVQADYTDLGESGGSLKLYAVHAAGIVGQRIELNGGIEHTRASFGLAPLDKRADIALGAKYLLTSPEAEFDAVRIAVGVGYSHVVAKNTYGYIVASKALAPVSENYQPIMGHLGLRYDRFDLNSIGVGTSNKASLYAGAEIPISNNGSFSVVGEVQSKNNKFGAAKVPYSLGLRYQPVGQAFFASVAVERQGLTGGNGLQARIGYTFNRATGSVLDTEQ